jgi:UDP-N-acetylmuramate--alanine ligase
MIAAILDQAGRDPGFVIGGLLNDYSTNARIGSGPMVLEVDESDGSHHRIPTDHMVCNFLEADHLNYYRDLDHIIEDMIACVTGNPTLKTVFANSDCDGNRKLMAGVARPVVSYGQEGRPDYLGRLIDRSQLPIRFEVLRHGDLLGEASLRIPGLYNVTNAMGAIAVATEMGVDLADCVAALASFSGLENRFTIVEAGGLTIVKDYISHPTGIRRVLESAAGLTTGRTFSVWKPYRYTLLNYLGDEYATAFDGSDEVLITTMYAAEEDPIPGIDTQYIVDKIRSRGMKVTFIPVDDDLIDALDQRVREGDQVIFFGGDDFFRMADAWARRLAGN